MKAGCAVAIILAMMLAFFGGVMVGIRYVAPRLHKMKPHQIDTQTMPVHPRWKPAYRSA